SVDLLPSSRPVRGGNVVSYATDGPDLCSACGRAGLPSCVPAVPAGRDRMKTVFTTGEAAKICKVSQQTIIRCFDNGQLKGCRGASSAASRGTSSSSS